MLLFGTIIWYFYITLSRLIMWDCLMNMLTMLVATVTHSSANSIGFIIIIIIISSITITITIVIIVIIISSSSSSKLRVLGLSDFEK